MDVVPPFVADPEAPELMQPGNRALHHPAEDAQPAAMRRAPAGQHGHDAALSQRGAVRLRVVGAVDLDARRPLTGAADLPADRRDGADDLAATHQARQGADVVILEGPVRSQGDLDGLFAVGGRAVAGIQGDVYNAEVALRLGPSRAAASNTGASGDPKQIR